METTSNPTVLTPTQIRTRLKMLIDSLPDEQLQFLFAYVNGQEKTKSAIDPSDEKAVKDIFEKNDILLKRLSQ